jgi:hypothetical protein
MQITQASFVKVAWTDYAASLGLLAPVTLLLVTVIVYFFGEGIESIWLYMTIGVCAVGPLLSLWRYSLISGILGSGIEVEGHVTRVSFFRGRGRVYYLYTFQGERYESSNAIQQNKYTRSLEIGLPVKVMVDRENPKKAFIKQLYQSNDTSR